MFRLITTVRRGSASGLAASRRGMVGALMTLNEIPNPPVSGFSSLLTAFKETPWHQ